MSDMASTDAPFGLKPWGNVLGAHMYAVVTEYGTAIYHNDLAEIVGEAVSTPLHGNLQKAAVEATGAIGSLLGAVLAIFDSDGDPVKYLAASTVGNGTIAGYLLVADHPDQEYLVAEDGDTSSIQVANVGLNVDMISTTSGSTSKGTSGMEIDSSTVATTSTLGFKIVGVHPDDTISSAGAAANHCRFICKMNAAHRGSNVDGA